MGRPIWFVNSMMRFFPERYRFARWTHLTVIGRAADKMLFEGDDIVYLPKDLTISINAEIEHSASAVLPSEIVNHFIDQANYHWVMDFCVCREADGCQDYSSKLGCIFLGEAVLRINPKLGRLVSKDEALSHTERCRQAGLVQMIGRNKGVAAVWKSARMVLSNLPLKITPISARRLPGLPPW